MSEHQLILKKGERMRIVIPAEAWVPAKAGTSFEVEVQYVAPYKGRDDVEHPNVTEVCLVPSVNSGVPGSPEGIRLLHGDL